MVLKNLRPSCIKDADAIVNLLQQKSEFRYLQVGIVDNEDYSIKSNFSRGTKQQIKLQTLVKALVKCPICGGYMDTHSISVDHIVRKQDGGSNSPKNAQVTHFYCNTTFKN